jgi:hypothetical protein
VGRMLQLQITCRAESCRLIAYFLIRKKVKIVHFIVYRDWYRAPAILVCFGFYRTYDYKKDNHNEFHDQKNFQKLPKNSKRPIEKKIMENFILVLILASAIGAESRVAVDGTFYIVCSLF